MSERLAAEISGSFGRCNASIMARSMSIEMALNF